MKWSGRRYRKRLPYSSRNFHEQLNRGIGGPVETNVLLANDNFDGVSQPGCRGTVAAATFPVVADSSARLFVFRSTRGQTIASRGCQRFKTQIFLCLEMHLGHKSRAADLT